MAATRSQDEMTLWLVRQRASGVSANQLAKRVRRHAGPVITATNNVLEADLAESGEDPEVVARAYWGRRSA